MELLACPIYTYEKKTTVILETSKAPENNQSRNVNYGDKYEKYRHLLNQKYAQGTNKNNLGDGNELSEYGYVFSRILFLEFKQPTKQYLNNFFDDLLKAKGKNNTMTSEYSQFYGHFEPITSLFNYSLLKSYSLKTVQRPLSIVPFTDFSTYITHLSFTFEDKIAIVSLKEDMGWFKPLRHEKARDSNVAGLNLINERVEFTGASLGIGKVFGMMPIPLRSENCDQVLGFSQRGVFMISFNN